MLDARAKLASVDGNGRDCASPDRYNTLLAAFPEDSHEMLIHENIPDPNRDPFRNAKARAISQLQHRAIAERERLVERWRADEPRHFVDSKNLRKRPPPLGRLESLARVAH